MFRGPALRWLFLVLALLLVAGSVVLPEIVQAIDGEEDLCASPQSAADSLFVAPRPGLACVDAPPATRARLAGQLSRILDARGLYVPVSSLSDDPAFGLDDGTDSIELMPEQAPWLELARSEDGRWRYSRRTMAQVPTLYEKTFSSASLWLQGVLPDAFQSQVPWIGGRGWQYAMGLSLLLVALAAGFLIRLIVSSQLQRVTKRLGVNVSAKVFRRLGTPVFWFVFTAIIIWRLPDLQLGVASARLGYIILSIAVGIAGVVVASRLVDVAAGIWAGHTEQTDSKLDDQLVPLVRQIGKLAVWAIGLIFVLQNNGVQVWSFVAGLGIGSLAFALAAQDTVANLFGALNIFLDKPFQVGDAIKVGGVEGTVEEVGFRSFRIRTFYNSLVTIPNSTITNTNVDNIGIRTRRRVTFSLGLSYDTPPDTLQAYVEAVRAILAANPSVQNTYEVHFNGFGGSSLDILVYYHVLSESWTEELETRAECNLECLRAAEALGVSFAFPSQSVYLEATPDRPLQAAEPQPLDALEQVAASFGPGGSNSRPEGPEFGRSWASQEVTSRGGV